MEQKFELKGPAGLIAIVVVVGGLLLWKGPAGVLDLIRTGKVRTGLSQKTLDTKGREELRAELNQDYHRRFVAPLMEKLGDDPAAQPDVAAQLTGMVKTINSLKLTRLSSRYRNRLDTGDRLELHIDVDYTMQPAPPDGVTNRTYSVNVYKRGRGRWEIRGEQ